MPFGSPRRTTGTVTVTFGDPGPEGLEMTVHDDGRGFVGEFGVFGFGFVLLKSPRYIGNAQLIANRIG